MTRSCSCLLMLRKTGARLREMITKRLAALTYLMGIDALRIRLKTTVLRRRRGFLGPAAINGVGLVRRTALIDGGAVHGITLAVMQRRYRAIDG